MKGFCADCQKVTKWFFPKVNTFSSDIRVCNSCGKTVVLQC